MWLLYLPALVASVIMLVAAETGAALPNGKRFNIAGRVTIPSMLLGGFIFLMTHLVVY
jgi:hypothetical protein